MSAVTVFRLPHPRDEEEIEPCELSECTHGHESLRRMDCVGSGCDRMYQRSCVCDATVAGNVDDRGERNQSRCAVQRRIQRVLARIRGNGGSLYRDGITMGLVRTWERGHESNRTKDKYVQNECGHHPDVL